MTSNTRRDAAGSDSHGAAPPGYDLPYRAVRLLADEVVVRLADRRRDLRGLSTVTDIVAFTDALTVGDQAQAVAMIRAARTDDVPFDTVYLHVLAAAARRMGDLWLEDRLSFVTMAVATGRVFAIMRMLRAEAAEPATTSEAQLLFASIPGETHTLGVSMAADMFRGRGWDVTLRIGMGHQALLDSLGDERYAVIGLSAGRPESIDALLRLIVALRLEQPQARLVVGGQIVESMTDLHDVVHVDALLHDGDDALAIIGALVRDAPV